MAPGCHGAWVPPTGTPASPHPNGGIAMGGRHLCADSGARDREQPRWRCPPRRTLQLSWPLTPGFLAEPGSPATDQ